MERGIFELGQNRPFSLQEANEVVRVICHFTKEMSIQVDAMIQQLEALDPQQVDRAREMEEAIELKIESWNNKVRRLGAQPKGLWIVDIDFGQGYYCWKFPETEIAYWHEYKSGFPGRKPLPVFSN